MSDGASTTTTATATATTDVAPPAAETTTALGGVDAKVETTDAKVTETKATETKAPGDAKTETKAEAPKPVLVDEKWEPKAVEGMTRDAKTLTGFRELAKKHGLNAEQAQALVDFSDAQAKATSTSAAAVMAESDAAWVKELAEDKEFGGAKQQASREAARTLIRGLKHGPAFSEWVDKVGIGNAAPLVRVFAELASKVSEDTVSGTLKETAAVQDPFQRAIDVTYGKSNGTRKES